MAAPGGPSGIAPLLLCRVGDKLCGVPLAQVLETMRPLPIEPLALGIAVIRGRPTPVVDGRLLFGGDASAPPKRFVTLEVTTERTAALAVDEVLDVRSVSLETLEPLPGLLRGERASAISTLGAIDRDLLVVLEGARLLPESCWLQVEGLRPP